jgi:fumarate hydratase subunit alpha
MFVRIINSAALVGVISGLFRKACVNVDPGMVKALKKARETEESPLGRDVLDTLLENAEYAEEAGIACCQDTGTAVVFMEIGQKVCWEGAPVTDMVNEGVRKGYAEGFLRKSMVSDPLIRINSGDNTPAVLHSEIVSGESVKITVMPKGGGSENMSRCAMLPPGAGAEGVLDFVTGVIEGAGGKPCPPVLVGVGIGGAMDTVAWLSKKALLRGLGEPNPQKHLAELEARILKRANESGIGPMGFGGRNTAVAAHVEAAGCHITGLPVSVSIQCHASRHESAEI